ncbi:MAG: hypothetical protein KKA48_00845, partial [Proteobacteria bacterium]|nr:hypothetical protein [Pseudomonadota bacterium]
HVGSELPDDFLLPDGTVVQFRMNSSSPFCIRVDDGGLKLFHRDREIAGVQWIKRYYDTGIKAIGYSMEIWDEALYRAICPGKSESTSHAEFLRSIESAVGVFGEGNGLQRSFARLRVS